MSSPAPVLILGAGVNGICVARELVLNGVPVWLVDTNDIAFGATAKSSRLIHGGLRYLEYGDFSLVAESLRERDRLLRLAPQFVTPLRLHIPIRRRLGGFVAAGLRFMGLSRTRLGKWIGSGGGRGLITVRFGLWLYDRLARSRMVPSHAVHHTGGDGPQFPVDQYPWSCAYFDAQMERPERFCVAMLREIDAVARDRGREFRVLTYHRAVLQDGHVRVVPLVDDWQLECDKSQAGEGGALSSSPPLSMTPSLIINATGAWGDFTLQELSVPAPQLLGGTKGTHLFTSHAGLAKALGREAVYAEASDGRLVFLIPLDHGVMIGTTDERFDQRPDEARSTEAEATYLLQLTNELFPQVKMTLADVYATCAGIRPLPHSDSSKTAAISRGHHVDERSVDGIPVLTLVGGKLTTCRAFGEEVADRVLNSLGVARTVSTRDRVILGGEDYPRNSQALEARLASLSASTGYPGESVRVMWQLMGAQVAGLSANDRFAIQSSPPAALISGTALPREFVREIIQTEWVTTLEDLIERRLLLALEPNLARATLVDLAKLLCDELGYDQPVDVFVERACQRLRTFYGRTDVSGAMST